MDQGKTLSILNELIETSKDGENGFRMSAEHAQSANLKSMFSELADHCAVGAKELQQLVRALGGKPEESGTIGGAAHRGWTELKTALSSNDDAVLLNECERGEDVAKKKYSEALKEDLPLDVETTIRRQYDGVLSNHDRIRNLRNSYVRR